MAQEEYADPQQLWQKAKGEDGTHKQWYEGAVAYWDAQEASYDGVLGGFGFVSDSDISDSRALLQRVRLWGEGHSTGRGGRGSGAVQPAKELYYAACTAAAARLTRHADR